MNRFFGVMFPICFFATFLIYMGNGWGKEFKLAAPGYSYHFPGDHGSHDDYQVEWWYFTGHLAGAHGKRAGFELTFFRSGVATDSIRQNPSKWRVENIYSAHFAISDESRRQFWFTEKISRAGLGRAGAEKDHFQTWIDRWQGKEEDGIFYLRASEGEGRNKKSLELTLVPEKPPVIHGSGGVSPKDAASTNRSHYYSLTRLKTSGTLILDGEERSVEGISWMDHEFGSSPLLPSQKGWDWFSIQFNNKTELMIYQIRNRDGSPPFSFGTFVDKSGESRTLFPGDFIIKSRGRWASPLGGSYPMEWEVTLPRQNLSLFVTPSFQSQELNVFGGQVTYWEGSVKVSEKSSTLAGVGYVELTGYTTELVNSFSQNGQNFH